MFKYVTDKKDRRRVLMVYAAAGMGKSRLLRFLAYQLLLKGNIKKNKDEPINGLPFIGHGVYYTEFINNLSIDELIDEIDEIKKSKKIKYLLLDGFDECHEYLNGESAMKILEYLFDKLDNRKIKEGISRIIITSRVDMLDNESEALKSLSMRTQTDGRMSEEKVDIIKMEDFKEKQVIHRYNIISKLHKIKGRKKIIKKLREHLKVTNESILRIPFFIRYTNDLFNSTTTNAINYLTRESGLHEVVKICIEKEYMLYTEAKENKGIKPDDYIAVMTAFFSKTAFKMYQKTHLDLSCEEYDNIPCTFKTEKERLFIVRKCEDNRDFFHFQHKLFFEYFLVRFIIDDIVVDKNEEDKVAFSLNERKQLPCFNDNCEQNMIESMFAKRLYASFLNEEKIYDKLRKNVKSFSESGNIQYTVESSKVYRLLGANNITIDDNPIWEINRIILLLPLTQSLNYRKFKISSFEALEKYVDERYLTLNAEALLDTSGASKLSKLALLDTIVGKIGAIEIKKFEEIDEIRVLIQNINDFKELLNIANVKKINLLVDVEPVVLPELVQMVVDENLKKYIRSFFYRISFCNIIKTEQINETLNSMKNDMEKMIFLEQLYFIEIILFCSTNKDIKNIENIFYELFKKNLKSSDVFLFDLLQKRIRDPGKDHPYTENLKRLYTNVQFELGYCYYMEHGVKKDYDMAFKWFQKAANQNNAQAQCWLGISYSLGNGCKEDPYEAFKWVKKAADQNHAMAQCRLGQYYFYGYGVDEDLHEAIEWYKKAFNQGDVYYYHYHYTDACKGMGHCYIKLEDYTKAIKWFQESADQGDANAQHNLGFCYYKLEDYTKAIEWFRKSKTDQSHKDSAQSWLDAINNKLKENT